MLSLKKLVKCDSPLHLPPPPHLLKCQSPQIKLLQDDDDDDDNNNTPLTTYFEVTKPINPPSTNPCSSPILHHNFSFTYGKPPVLAHFNPPTNCPFHNFSKIVLEWKATCKGRQFDRIFGVWVGGVEVLRSCTAEPRASGIVWTVEKDITRYSSLLKTPQIVSVFLGNIVDSTYTGVYNVELTFHFHPFEGKRFGDSFYDSVVSPADLILPISRNSPLNDGHWFPVANSSDVWVKEFGIPRNAYRAVLEVYVSFHENDESWYGNPPNDYLIANNVTGTQGNGAFREVVVSLDGVVIGAVWPFAVVYTGGVNPLLWRPITGIGSFDLPSYDIEVTPFLGRILDGKRHEFGFGVTNALNLWFIDANLHVWLDDKIMETEGGLIEHNSPQPSISLVSSFKGRNGTFLTTAVRNISSTGWVKSSHGIIMTNSFQDFDFVNLIKFGKGGKLQTIRQDIYAKRRVHAARQSSFEYSYQLFQNFPLKLYTEDIDMGNGSYFSVANITMGFNEERSSGSQSGFMNSSLKNLQTGQGYMFVKGNLVTRGLGSTQQVYKYNGYPDCYFRNVSSSNYTILYDRTSDTCTEKWKTVSVERK
ncbi:hypothetical protein Syun_008871 [Stephania yunnanensis]|uniref:Peptide N-acetyl-beta-D-glucosaminyl asparaginase amidase A N-terminal domain-containing protein n=1 Tax=Stephania yunnanensis TaxID=152371 RepID=A0AAP0PNI7_9MAGN